MTLMLDPNSVVGFTPSPDCIRDEIDIMAANVFGAVWRFSKGQRGQCDATLAKISKRAGYGTTATRVRLRLLAEGGWILEERRKGRPTVYRDAGRWVLKVVGEDTEAPTAGVAPKRKPQRQPLPSGNDPNASRCPPQRPALPPPTPDVALPQREALAEDSLLKKDFKKELKKSGADTDLEASADDTGNDTAATSASALIDDEAAPSCLDHWAGGSAAFNALADRIAKWMGKAPEGLHPATAKAIKSGVARLLAREITAEDISATYGRRWFREHWAGGDRSKTVVDRSPRDVRQIEDWIATCDATPEPADRVAIDEALAASASASVDTSTQPDPPAVHPWLIEAVAMGGARPGSTFGRWLATASLLRIEDGAAVVEVPDEAAAAMLSSRPGALVWPAESGATATRFVAAGLATQVAE